MREKILFFTGSQSRTGGTERVCADIASGLVEKNFDVGILSIYAGLKSSFQLSQNIKLSELFSKNRKGIIFQLITAIKLFFYIKKNKPDVIIAVESLIFINLLPLLLLPKRPKLICWEHFNVNIDLCVKTRNIARNLATKFADKIIVLTEEDRSLWLEKYTMNENKIIHIYNPNPFNFLKNQKNQKKSNTIIAVGRLTHQKGFDILLNAWVKIPETIRSNWKLEIIGEGEDRLLLENFIKNNDLSSTVKLVGHSENINIHYKTADIFVLSSRFEGFGLVLLEALTYSIPIISFECPAGPKEIINHNVNGYLVNNGDVDELSSAIKLLMTNEKLRKSYSTNSIPSLKKFDKSKILKKWENIFKNLKDKNDF